MRKCAYNRFAVLDRALLARVVGEMVQAVGGQRKLARLGGIDHAHLSRMKNAQAAELEPATFRALYNRACTRVGVYVAKKEGLSDDDRLACIIRWKEALDQATEKPEAAPPPPVLEPGPVIDLDRAQKPDHRMTAFLARLVKHPRPIRDWPRGQFLSVSRREAEALDAIGLITTIAGGKHYALLWDPAAGQRIAG